MAVLQNTTTTTPPRRTRRTRRKRSGDDVIAEALRILERRIRKPGAMIAGSVAAMDYMKLHMAELEHEVFAVLWLDNKHRVIAFEPMFRGTINRADIHPREVVKSALRHNAAAAILVHNHPSGVAEPSMCDRSITHRVMECLSLVEVFVLDHIIVGGTDTLSMREFGELFPDVTAQRKRKPATRSKAKAHAAH